MLAKPLAMAVTMVGILALPMTAGGGETGGAFHSDRLMEMETTTRGAIAAGRTPGAVLWLERDGVSWRKAIGHKSLKPRREPAEVETIYDVASLTKPVATATALMLLLEEGKLGLDDTLGTHLPEFAGGDKAKVTIRQILTHHSGLRAGLASPDEWTGTGPAIALAAAQAPAMEPGAGFLYSDVNFILLGRLVEHLSGLGLDAFCKQRIFDPLGMKDTGFRPMDPTAPPVPAADRRIAPTERLKDGTVLRGVVHDPTARRMGGVAGHAGLFTTAADLARFCRMLLNGGRLDGIRLLKEETVALMTSVQSPAGSARRGLGWDIDSPLATQRGMHFPVGGFGHTGWTGPSMWIDPFSRTFLLILCNRNHPHGGNGVTDLRRDLATLAAGAVREFNFVHVPGALAPDRFTPAMRPGTAAAPVLNGIDVLVRDGFRQLEGLRVGLVTNASGHDRRRSSTIDLLHRAPNVKLVSLFSPEHGIRGDLDQEKIPDGRDAATGLPVHSLYGERRTPEKRQLEGLDALVFDIQDVGCRFYTYLSTLTHCMEAAGNAGIRFIVLDRVNPIGPLMEGPLLSEPRSFVGIHEIPLRHGMTLGELALLIRHERKWNTDLSVIACEGGHPVSWFDQTGQPWTHPSPNLRNPTAALLYPGVGMLEFCRLSVGRGTDSPFEILGAPWIDDLALASALNRAAPPGLRFTPVRFSPVSSVFAGQACAGVRITVTDRNQVRSCELGLLLAHTLERLHPGKAGLDACLKLLGDRPSLDALKRGEAPAVISARWQQALAEFERRRRPHLLYPRP